MYLHDERHFCYILESRGKEINTEEVAKISIKFQMVFQSEYQNKTSEEFENLRRKFESNVSMFVDNCSSKWFFLVLYLSVSNRSSKTAQTVKKIFLKIKTPETCAK